MSASTSSDHNGSLQQRSMRRRHPASKRRMHVSTAIPDHGDQAERAFWARLEEREDGRFALEADHLFDTSYPWAV